MRGPDGLPGPVTEKAAALLPEVQLQPHQTAAADALQTSPRRLLYFGLGSGKTLSALAGAERSGDPATFVSPASLRENTRKEYAKFTDQKTPLQAVSYNQVASQADDPPPAQGGTLVVDEAHNLRNPNSKRFHGVRRLADKADRLMLLTGTPIVNTPGDLAPLLNLLNKQDVTPEEFEKQYTEDRKVSPGLWGRLRGVHSGVERVPRNLDKLKAQLKGKVDYYQPAESPVEERVRDVEVPMSETQQSLYKLMWNKLPFWTRWKLQRDFPFSPSEAKKMTAFLSGPRQVGLSTLPFQRGREDLQQAFEQSPKLQTAMANLQKALANPEAKAVAFSNFPRAGLEPYAAALTRAGVPNGIFRGGMSDKQRKEMVDGYNSGKLRALLLGPAGSEGISLKGTRLLQLLDPHWNETRLAQAVGRGVRYDSHTSLPEEDRNIQIERYRARLPAHRSLLSRFFGKTPDRYADGVDDYLARRAGRREEINDRFRSVLKEVGTPSS